MKKEGISTFKVAATYIGTIIGAGFATGQEMLQFFNRFGIFGVFGLALATFLFIFFGYIIMDIGKKLDAKSHLEIIKYSGGRFLGTIIDFIITFFLFGALTAMIAGTGALFSQQFQISSLYGNILMTLITAITVFTGINGVINSISFVVPFLLAAVIGTSIFAMIQSPPDIFATVSAAGEVGLINNWFMAAILYISYNTIISIAVLGPLGVKSKNKKVIRNGAILGGLGLGLGAVMIFLAQSGDLEKIAGIEVPMVYIAGNISALVQVIYTIVLIAEIYTTAVGSLYGFAARVTDIKRSGRWKLVIVGVSIAAFFASQLGFSNLVKYLYPLVGYGGIILLISLLYIRIKNYRASKQ